MKMRWRSCVPKKPHPASSEKGLTNSEQYKSVLNGVLVQGTDTGNYTDWKRRRTTRLPSADLVFANLVCETFKEQCHRVG